MFLDAEEVRRNEEGNVEEAGEEENKEVDGNGVGNVDVAACVRVVEDEGGDDEDGERERDGEEDEK